jgi:hypothetical protein
VVLDQGDVLGDFIEWNLHLGVDLILVQDLGSSDGSHALLEEFAQKGRVQWFIAPEKDMKKYKHGEAPAKSARDSHGADWIVLCDADEFLCPVGADLRTILRDADDRQVTLLKAPCLNMTGPKIEPGQSATEALTLRIDKPPVELAVPATDDLRVPYIFIQHPPHTIVRASALVEYGPGFHDATVSRGEKENTERLRFLHYNFRSYDKFEAKVRNVETWLAANTHLPPWWGWHWRRWIRLKEGGRLREEYDSQLSSTLPPGSMR